MDVVCRGAAGRQPVELGWGRAVIVTQSAEFVLVPRVVLLAVLALGLTAAARAQDPDPGAADAQAAELQAARQDALQRLAGMAPTAFEERLGLLESLLESFAFAPDDALELDLRLEAGDQCLNLERYGEARRHFERGAELAGRSDRVTAEVVCAGNLAWALLELGALDEARDSVLAGLQAEQRIDVPESRWRLLNMLGGIEQRRGASAEAFEAYRRALDVVQQLQDGEGLKVVLNNVGVSALEAGRPEEALQFFERSHEAALAQDDRLAMAAALANSGDVLHQLERDEEALVFHEQAFAIREEQGSARGLVSSHAGLGVTHHGLGHLERAAAHLEQALDMAEAQGLGVDRVQILASLAQVYADMGRADDSLAAARDSAEALESGSARSRQSEVLRALARATEAQGDLAAALEHTRAAAAVDAQLAKQFNESYTLLLLDMESRALDAETERNRVLTEQAERAEAESARRAALNRSLIGLVVAAAAAALLGFLLLASKRRAHRELSAAHARLERAHATVAERNAELERARRTIDRLEGFLSLCANCKAWRNQDGDWMPVEGLIHEHVDAEISHGICPACMEERYGLKVR